MLDESLGLGPGFFAFLFFGIMGLVSLNLTGNHRDRTQFQFKLFATAFALRFLFSIIIYAFGLVNVLGDEDGSGWGNGVIIANQWTMQHMGFLDLPSAWRPAFDNGHRGYGFMLGTLFWFTDAGYRMVAAVLNNFIGAMTVILVYRVTRSIFSEWTAVRAAWWCCFMPSLVIWSAQTVKEPTVILLETAALYACIRLQSRSFRVRHFWLLLFCLTFLVTFRFYAAYLAILAVVVSLAMPNLRKINFSTVSSALVAIVLVVLLYSSGTLIQNETMLEKFDLKAAQKFRADVAQGAGSGVSMDVNLETPVGFVYGVGLGAAYLLLAPFPWQWGGGSIRMLLTLPELLVWWYVFYQFVIPGFKKAVKERFFDILAVLILLGGLLMLYSVMFGNVGLAYRQRAQLLPWMLIFAAVGMEMKAREKLMRQMPSRPMPIRISTP